MREHGARKTSTEDNFKDVWRQFWRKSSPLLGEMDGEKKTRGNKDILVKSEIDMLVSSPFGKLFLAKQKVFSVTEPLVSR